MLGPDQALDNLRRIHEDFKAFCAGHGAASEADTRAKIIDKILTDVCGWPEAALEREVHAAEGYIDYSLTVQGRRFVAVEAKREGAAFELPVTTHRSLRLSGAMLTVAPIRAAITQVRGYCDDEAIRYGIATNGYAWILFRAIREDIPWRDGLARIFSSIEHITQHFTEFWNLLSYEAISTGSLDTAFGLPPRVPRKLLRVIDHLYDADLPLQRNRLHAQLYPIIRTVFDDIASQDYLELLRACYVHSGTLEVVASDLDFVIRDAIPKFLLDQGTEPLIQGRSHAGAFDAALASGFSAEHGQLILLLGGIGSGKTTFIRRYQKTVGHGSLDRYAVWFHIDFLGPTEPESMEQSAWKQILEDIRTRYNTLGIESRSNIKKAFATDIAALRETVLAHAVPDSDEDERILSPYLAQWQSDLAQYLPRLLHVASVEYGRKVVIFIDNVDQLSPTYQAKIFLFAQRLTRLIPAVTVVSLREESYYTANTQKTFTAYSNRKFHIESPEFRKLIGMRIGFALRSLRTSPDADNIVTRGGISIDREAIASFLRIVERSIFQRNRNIARFIEAVCFGNMRLALEMFNLFLESGAADVDKMLRIYRTHGAYYVPFHEFLKSVMLGERHFYKESRSRIMNVFDCGTEKNASHFTALRLLAHLLEFRTAATAEGPGYTGIGRIINVFEDVFDNAEDVVRTLNRLVQWQLVEVNTRSTSNVVGASYVRATSAGWYYARYLVKSFPYLDLVSQDTPLNSVDVERELRGAVAEAGNISADDGDRIYRLEVRFGRVRRFLDYLAAEEATERARVGLLSRSAVIEDELVPVIRAQVEEEIDYIRTRFQKKREAVPEDIELGRTDEIPEATEDAEEEAATAPEERPPDDAE